MARDRLTGALGHRPHDAEALELLIDAYLAMGDLPAAGRWLMLSERDDARARSARALFESRHRRAGDLARSIPAKPPLEGYPHTVRERLLAIGAEARAAGAQAAWMRSADAQPDVPRTAATLSLRSCLADSLAMLAVAGIAVVPWLLGLAFAIALLAGWVHFG